MTTSFEELKVLRSAETIADDVWKQVIVWEPFARDVVGGQLARAVDSIGANIAEAFGRFHYGEKLQFLYYARGSLFEAKYWINRAKARDLVASDQVLDFGDRLTALARQLNAFAGSLKTQRLDGPAQPKTGRIRESTVAYVVDTPEDSAAPLFSESDLQWLLSLSPTNP